MSYREDLKYVLSGKIEIFHGTSYNFVSRTMCDARIDSWFAQNEAWARGHAESSFVHSGNLSRVLSAAIAVGDPLYVGNFDDIATDSVFEDIADVSGVDIKLLKYLRNQTGGAEEELDELVVFEVVNTNDFLVRIQDMTFDGIVAFEDGGRESVFCVVNRERIKFKMSKVNVTDMDLYHDTRRDDLLGGPFASGVFGRG